MIGQDFVADMKIPVMSEVLTYISDLFFLDCQLTAGMAILAVIKVMCPAQSVVSTVGIFYLSYIA